MGRGRKQSGLEDMIDAAALLPWRIALVLAVVLYAGLHYWATISEPPPRDLAAMGAFAGRQLYRTLAMYLQYLIPGILLIGAIISAVKGSRQRKQFETTRQLGTRGALLHMT
jgi:restriction system protein